MELTPKLLTDDVDFRIALRGYDKDEVDDFLERVAVAVGQLQEQLSSAVDRARKAEARAQQAQASPPPVEAPAESSTVATGDEADELNEELRRTLVLAQRTADAAIREAREEAARITAEADEQRTHTLESASAESQRASDEAKGRLLAELAELEAVRNGLQTDITVLDRHLGEHRAKVRETVQVLRRLVDDPQSFTVQPTPPLSVDTVPTAPADTPAAEPEAEAGDDAPVPLAVLVDELPNDPVPAPRVAPEPVAQEPAPAPALPTRDRTPARGTPAVTEPEQASAPRAAATPSGPGAPTAMVATERRTTAPVAGSPRPPVAARRPANDPGLDLRVGGDRADVAIGGATRAAESTGHRLGGLFADEAPSSWRQTDPGRGDQGPHTQPVAATRLEEEPDDAFLAELRRAMTDEEPLGPRDGIESVPFATPEAPPRTRFRRFR
jgi:DivIVA domain-containing protein